MSATGQVGREPAPSDAESESARSEERGLLERAQRGDLAAYEAIVERYEQVAFRLAYLLLRDAAEAEDATQEAFVRAFGALSRFRLGEPFRPWLLRIVANQAISARRADRRRDALAQRLQSDALSSGEPSPESAALSRERRDAVLAALATLKQEDQLVLHLRYFLELGEAEVAAALSCARGTVKSRLHRAQARLRRALVPFFPELASPLPEQDELV
jgi:RNA polymerase sigma-70 factor (ECF subfamily)